MKGIIAILLITNLLTVSMTGCADVKGEVVNNRVDPLIGAVKIEKIPTKPELVESETIVSNNVADLASEAEKETEVESFNVIDINISRRYLHQEMVEDIKRLEEAYPCLIKTEVIGQSADNRDIYLVKLGKGDYKSLMLGGVHAREIAATPLLIKMINEYAKSYYTEGTIDGFNAKKLLDKVTLYIVPSVNPDGMEIAVRKEPGIRDDNLRNNLRGIPGYYVQWKANACGVDLNRNFPNQYWGKVLPGKTKSNLIHTKPHAEFYGGPYPGSENETQAIINLFENNDFKIMFDIHSKGRVIFWYKEAQSQEFNDKNYKIAQAVSKASGYDILPQHLSTFGEGTDGTTTDFAAERGVQCLTIETVPYSAQFPFTLETILAEWDHVKNIGLVLAQETIKLCEADIN